MEENKLVLFVVRCVGVWVGGWESVWVDVVGWEAV